MRCRLKTLMGQTTENQSEVIEMILSDSEGYHDELAAQCISTLRPKLSIEPDEVSQHRSKRCGCEEQE